MSTCTWLRPRRKFGTWSIARFALPRPNAPSPASSFPTMCRKCRRWKLRRANMARCTRELAIPSPRVIPKDSDLRRAADVLNAGQKVAMLVGAGALQATDEVIEVADILGAGVAKALLGKAVIPDDLPFCTGPIGLLGSKPSWDMMNRVRHAAHGRIAVFRIRNFCPRKGKRAVCRSTSIPKCSAFVIRRK